MPPMTTCPDRTRLKELLDGSLPEAEQADLNRHLDGCEPCQHTLEELAAGKETWSGVAEQLRQCDSTPEAGLRRVLEENRAGSETGPESGDESPLDFLSPSDDPAHLGRIAQYEILEVIGRGGNGVVLKAFDTVLRRIVAVKVLSPQLATTASARRRFERESRAAAAVSHEHVVAIYEVGETNGLPYLVMEYVAGPSLQERLDRAGPLALKEVLRIGRQTACGLAAAHAQGLVHRDVKPANILLHNGVERVKITDFGLARAVDDATLTRSGFVAGTPQYMAPEQARGEAVDHRADLFSLGSVLYAMCTGRPPFRASTTLAVLKRVAEDEPRPAAEVNPDVPAWLAAVIAKLHAKDPADRYQSAAEVADLLGQCLASVQEPSTASLPKTLSPAPRPPRRRRWAVAAVLLPLIAGALVVSEATGVTHVAEYLGTVLHIRTADGTLVVEVDDPQVLVSVDGEWVSLKGAGLQEIRVRPGQHEVKAVKDGRQVPLDTPVVTITRGGKQVVRVRQVEDVIGLRPVEPHPDQVLNFFVNSNRELLQGTWVGGPVAADGKRGKTQTWVIRGSQLTMFAANGDQLFYIFKLGPPERPKEIDLIEGPEGEVKAKGICEVVGETLRVCVASVKNGPRPTEFKTHGDQELYEFRRDRNRVTADGQSVERYDRYVTRPGGGEDFQKLQGIWEGKRIDEKGAAVETVRWHFAGQKLVIESGARSRYQSGFSIDPTQRPKAIDITLRDPNGGGPLRQFGIYELKGDSLKVCTVAGSHHPRPTEFKTRIGEHTQVLFEFRRQSAAPNEQSRIESLLRERLAILNEVTAEMQKAFEAGRLTQAELLNAKVNKLDTEIRLEKAKGEPITLHVDVPVELNKDGKSRALFTERLHVLQSAATDLEKLAREGGRVSRDEVLQAKLRALEAELALCETDQDRVKVHDKIVAVAREREEAADQRVKAGQASKAELLQARAQRIDAEVARERARTGSAAATRGVPVQPAENAGVRALLQKRLDALKEMAEQAEAASRHGTAAPGDVVRARLQVLAAALALCQSDAERVKVHERIVAQAKQLEEIADKLVQAGRAPRSELLKARAERLDAEIELERARARAAGQPGTAAPPKVDVKGVVTKVKDGGLVEISIGPDAGIEKGHTLEVYRLKPQPVYLGKVTIVEVTPTASVGRAEQRTRELRPGDQVTDRILDVRP